LTRVKTAARGREQDDNMKTVLLAGTFAAFASLAAGVAIFPADKSSPVVQVTAGGPICMISVPKGNYRIDATYAGVSRNLSVAADTRPARAVFAFPEEPWDGIKASDEEKQQATRP
jgi:hypothetical protein